MVRGKYETGRGGMRGCVGGKIIMVRWSLAAKVGFKTRVTYVRVY